ncbi:hypothetical protein K503DRAFT_856319 [Rhizopogon vinicolor AM-OR11-026]|uniref:Copper acquisition factor BIM1-like domain-containing protein n=1 Tax=Rhizopogon vinicolor AM-OR11-026 TaxID=1314800 RepID=A0A1B7N2B2_9AGAM|nr:hypothetical protein K503DRAFT_856319 [Rhizopogon vinicolor AM-OR11-026]
MHGISLDALLALSFSQPEAVSPQVPAFYSQSPKSTWSPAKGSTCTITYSTGLAYIISLSRSRVTPPGVECPVPIVCSRGRRQSAIGLMHGRRRADRTSCTQAGSPQLALQRILIRLLDGYNDAVSNRTVFPLSNAVINLNSEHPLWTAGVIVSIYQGPNNFSDFNSSSGYQMGVRFFQQSGEGLYCFPIDLATSNISGVQDGANIAILIISDYGDGILYQCADLTLSANASVPAGTTSTSTATAASSTSTSSAGKEVQVASGFIVGVVTMMMALLPAL